MQKLNRYKTIDEYIANFPPKVRSILRKIRTTIKIAAPDAKEKISYGIPTFDLNGNLVHFAAYKSHIGFYPTSSGINKFKKEFVTYRVSKGTVRFPIDTAIPYDLIKQIVEFRVEENTAGTHRQ